MAKEFIITDDLIVFSRASVGRINASDSSILGTLDVYDETGASVKLISTPSTVGRIDFGESDASPDNGSLLFDHSATMFELEIGGTPQITVTSGGVTITNDLTVQGTTTIIDTTNLEVTDNVILLNDGEGGAGVTLGVAGIEIDRGTLDNSGWYYNETQNWWGPTGPSGTFGAGIGATQTIGNIAEINATDATDEILTITSSGAMVIPSGTDAQEPTASNGMIRYNTDNDTFDFVSGGSWKSLDPTGTNSDWVAVVGDTMTGDLTMNGGQILLDDAISLITAPALAFRNDTNTGVHWPGADQVSIVTGGTAKLAIDATGNITQTGNNVTLSGNGALRLHNGTTGNRPGSPANGMIRYNTSNGELEAYVAGSWRDIDTVSTGGGFVEQAGDTMTGDLIMSGANIRPLTNNTQTVGTSSFRFNTMYATTFDGTATMAQYADLAERYAVDMQVEAGDVVIFGGEAEITKCSVEADTAVAGIISEKPGVMMNHAAGDNKTHPYVALKGKVPCKVVGPVKKGDLLVTSEVLGYGRSVGKNAEPYTAFARAIEDFNGTDKELGVVTVSVI